MATRYKIIFSPNGNQKYELICCGDFISELYDSDTSYTLNQLMTANINCEGFDRHSISENGDIFTESQRNVVNKKLDFRKQCVSCLEVSWEVLIDYFHRKHLIYVNF